MTWEERAAREKNEELKAQQKLEQELDAARLVPPAGGLGKGKKKKKRRISECPPAPRNTTAFLIAEHRYAWLDILCVYIRV